MHMAFTAWATIAQANPCGDQSRPSVAKGNLCLIRFLLLVLVAVARGCQWIIENPASSIMMQHPRVKALIAMGEQGIMPKLCIQRVWLGAYGHLSPKPVVLFGDASDTWSSPLFLCIPGRLCCIVPHSGS